MTQDHFYSLLATAVQHGRGWVYGGDIPRCGVLCNGVKLKCVASFSVGRGAAKVYITPLRLDKHRKRILTTTIRGKIEAFPL